MAGNYIIRYVLKFCNRKTEYRKYSKISKPVIIQPNSKYIDIIIDEYSTRKF